VSAKTPSLNAAVAEALGCSPMEHKATNAAGEVLHTDWYCRCSAMEHVDLWPTPTSRGNLKRYDTDWSAGGPLIERYRLSVGPTYTGRENFEPWTASEHVEHRGVFEFALGPTPLVAACRLILALHRSGRLPK
jgi:hypothetical protein